MSRSMRQRIDKLVTETTKRRRFRPYVTTTSVGDRTFPFFIGDPIAERWYASGNKPRPEFDFLEREVIAPGDVVIECGGHHGQTALLLSDFVGPEGHVVTFEPFSRNVDVLCRNTVLNHRANVTVEHAVVGAASGTTRLFKKSNAKVVPSRLTSAAVNHVVSGVETVPVVTVDDYVDRHGLQPTVLKIDVEGFETEVLKGATKVLGTLPKIALEIHTPVLGRYGTTVAEVLSFLDLDRYRTWMQWNDDEEPRPYDGTEPITTRVHLFAVPLSP